jgi:hypothetical protein
MLIVRRFIVGVALLVAALGDSSGQTQRPQLRSSPPSVQPAPPPASEQRGTDQSPLSVKVVPTPISKEDAEKAERERQEKSEIDQKVADQTQKIAFNTFWLAIFTFALFCAAMAQIGLFWIQLRAMRKGVNDAAVVANAAQASADAARRAIVLADDSAQRQSRAYVMIHNAVIERLTSGSKPIAKLTIKNTGQTPAHGVTQWCSSGIAPYPILDHVVRALKGREVEKPARALPPTGETEISSEGEILTEAQYEALSDGTHALYVMGEIRYLDAFNKPQETDFLLFAGGPRGLSGELVEYQTGNRVT